MHVIRTCVAGDNDIGGAGGGDDEEDDDGDYGVEDHIDERLEY